MCLPTREEDWLLAEAWLYIHLLSFPILDVKIFVHSSSVFSDFRCENLERNKHCISPIRVSGMQYHEGVSFKLIHRTDIPVLNTVSVVIVQ